MKTFKGRARGWFYADQLLRAAKENLDSSGCGEGEGACRVSTLTNLPRGVPRQQPQTKERDEWGTYVRQRAETHEEGSQAQGMSPSLCASVSPLVTGVCAWMS